MSTKRVCKVCRAELQTLVCKFCGFKEKTIRIGDSQEGFTKVSHFNRVNRNQQKIIKSDGVPSESRLKLYLRQFSRMLKGAAANLVSKLSLTLEEADRFTKEFFNIWKLFLLKRQSEGFCQAGIFKKYLSNDHSDDLRGGAKEEGINKEFKLEKEQNSIENDEDQQRKLSPASGIKKTQQKKKLTSISKFRSFYAITLKPQLKESIEQRKCDETALTSIQKGFLAYLLAANEYELPLLKASSQKYLKLLLKIRGKTVKSYMKCKQVDYELTVRNLEEPLRKEEIAYSILLFDLLLCLTQLSQCSLATLLREYSLGPANLFIDRLTEVISLEEKPQSPNTPQLSFELAYSIVYLAANLSNCCVSPSEVISGCGILQLRISDKQAETIRSEENISAVRVRKSAHLLASFLSLKPCLNIPSWIKKSAQLFHLEGASSKVTVIMEVLMREEMQRRTKQFQGVWLNGQRTYKYFRYPQLEQDIAVTAAFLLFIKMSTGLTSYPYLLQFPVEMQAQGAQASIISQLKQQGQLLIAGSSLTTRLFLPKQYSEQIDLLQISKTMHSIQAKDRLLSLSSFNRVGVRLRNLSHLTSTSSEEIKRTIAPVLPLEVIIRYQQASLQQFLQASLEQNKRLRGQRAKVPTALKERQLSANVERQLRVIKSPDESIVKQSMVDRSRQCQVDKPCSNYEFLLDYGEQNLKLSGRFQLLHFLQHFCLNAISYSQLSQWLLRLEGLLKPFQM